MKKSIYQLALSCKTISDEKMGTDRNIFPFKGIVFTDYTVKGAVDEYLKAIEEFCSALADKYPSVALDTLERELTDFYGLPRKGGEWSRQRQNFVDYLGSGYGDNKIASFNHS